MYQQLGFKNVYALLGGMQGWQAAGYALVSDSNGE
jgi:rhodanese-related sulfurtransferase